MRELIAYCNNQSIILPNYRKLQDLYTEAFQSELQRISKIITTFPIEVSEKIDKLISEADDYRDLNDELNVLFNPRFNEDLEFHYKYQESYIFFRFITYSMNIKLISDKYAQVYNFAIKDNKSVKKAFLKKNMNIGVPLDSSMNILKLKKILSKIDKKS